MRRRSAVLLSLLVLACSDPVAPEPLGARLEVFVPDAAATLMYGDVSGTTLQNNVVATDSARWAWAWKCLFAGSIPQPPRPDVDFSANNALVALWRGGGSEIRIDSIVRFDQGARVYVTRRWGYGGGMQVEVNMAQVVLAPKWPIVDVHTQTVN